MYLTKITRLVIFALLWASIGRAATCVETGQFAANTGSDTTTVNHSCGVTPVAIILWTTGQTATGIDSAANASWSYGFSDGTNSRSIGWASDDNVGTTNAGNAFRTDRIVEVFSAGTPTTTRYLFDVNFNSSNFSAIWDGTPAAAYLVSYMVLGGSDITNAVVGTHTLPTTGTPPVANSITGLAFQPTFGIFMNTQNTAAGTGTRVHNGIGFAASSTKEFAMCWAIDDGQTMTANIDAVSYTNQEAMQCGITAGAETIDFLMDFTSFNSDGATFSISNLPGAAWLMPYMLIKGGQWDVGTGTFPSANGDEIVTGMAFQPKGLFIGTPGVTTANATVTINAASLAGAAASTTSDISSGAQQLDAVLNTSVERNTANDGFLPSVSSGTRLTFTSFNSDGWTLNWAGGAATAYQYGWFAMADNAAAPTSSGAGWWGSQQFGF